MPNWHKKERPPEPKGKGNILEGGKFLGVCLRGSELGSANLKRTKLALADLRDADLRGADLEKAVLLKPLQFVAVLVLTILIHFVWTAGDEGTSLSVLPILFSIGALIGGAFNVISVQNWISRKGKL